MQGMSPCSFVVPAQPVLHRKKSWDTADFQGMMAFLIPQHQELTNQLHSSSCSFAMLLNIEFRLCHIRAGTSILLRSEE